MLAPQTSAAAVRKGTKSCTECRRRKVRCVRMPEDAPICRQCTERNTACLAQTSSARPRQAQRLPSRHRIAQLESQVSRLTRVVNNIEFKLGGDPSTHLDQPTTHSLGSDDSDDESIASEILFAEEPTQLRSLFQNDWLSADTHRRHELLQERRVKASAHILESVRPLLQKLIPSKEETTEMLTCSYDWLQMIHCMLPQPSVPNSNQEVLEQREEMCRPDVDVATLASWLLTVAITSQQIPQGGPEFQSKSSQRRLDFARTVSDAVETLVLTHDRIVGTVEGLGMTIHFIRLQMGRGNPQKAWLKLRHIIALAELMGLPKAAQLARVKKTNGAADDPTRNEKVQLWDLICTLDRLLGIMINLPLYTRRYPLRTPDDILIDGVVQPAAYISRLVDITPKIYDLEEMSATEGQTTKLYTSALEIAREARNLASQTPKNWWVIQMTDDLKPDHIIQYMHYCIVMKAYLPIALRQDRCEEYLYSRLACMDSCECIAERYQFLRRKLPSGFFTVRLLDLQAFAAMVSLLLMSHTAPSVDRRSFQIDKARLEGVVAQVIELMEEKSKDRAGSSFAERGANTLRALRSLLQQEDTDKASARELTVNVPLLGNIHIRRNMPKTQPPVPQTQPPAELMPQLSGCNQQMIPVPYNPRLNTTAYMQDAILAGYGPPEMQWENLSWSIEDGGDNLLDDVLMGENFDQVTEWQNAYYNFPFS